MSLVPQKPQAVTTRSAATPMTRDPVAGDAVARKALKEVAVVEPRALRADTPKERQFAEIVEHDLPSLLRIARRRVGSDALAEEVVQDVLAKLSDDWPNLTLEQRSERTIRARTRNRANDIAKRESRMQELPDAAAAMIPSRHGDRHDLVFEAANLYNWAMSKLTERCREALELRNEDGCSREEIAAAMGITEMTVKSYVEDGLRQMRQLLESQGCHAPAPRSAKALPKGAEASDD